MEEIPYSESGEALQQSVVDAPLPGSVRGYVGWGFGQRGIMEGVATHGW